MADACRRRVAAAQNTAHADGSSTAVRRRELAPAAVIGMIGRAHG
jgi:hypothetical protein